MVRPSSTYVLVKLTNGSLSTLYQDVIKYTMSARVFKHRYLEESFLIFKNKPNIPIFKLILRN